MQHSCQDLPPSLWLGGFLLYTAGMHKKLYRSEKNRVLAGVCGGIAEYFDIDATILRLFWMLIVIFTGIFPGVIAYIFAIIIMPLPPHAHAAHTHATEKPEGAQHHP
jgi:phage shock protein C